MTVIAYDGRYVAADKQASREGTCYITSKLRVHENAVFAYCGNSHVGHACFLWFKAGCPHADWPQRGWTTKHEDATNIFVFRPDVPPVEISLFGVPYTEEGDVLAFGSGKDLALGALLAGASAERAVEIANERDAYCGMGVDVIDLWSLRSADPA